MSSNRAKGTKEISTNFEGKFGWTFDARNMVQSYADLLAFDLNTDYIRNGFPVAVFDADDAKKGIYICINETAISNPAAWWKVGGVVPFSAITGDPYSNILLKNILDSKQSVANQLITQVSVNYANGEVTIASLAENTIRWVYAGSQYSIPSPVVIPIPSASDNMYRTDLIYATTGNLMLRRAGGEYADAAIAPTLQANEVFVTTVDVFGDSEVNVTQPDFTLYAKKADPNVFTNSNTFERALKLNNKDGGGYDFYDEAVFRGSIKFDRISGEFKLLSAGDDTVVYEWISGDRETKKMTFAGAVAGSDAENDDEYITLGQLNARSSGPGIWSLTGRPSGYNDKESAYISNGNGGYTLYINTAPGNTVAPGADSTWRLVNEGEFVTVAGTPYVMQQITGSKTHSAPLQIGSYLQWLLGGGTKQIITRGVMDNGKPTLKFNLAQSSSPGNPQTVQDADDLIIYNSVDLTVKHLWENIFVAVKILSAGAGSASADQLMVLDSAGNVKKLAANYVQDTIDDSIETYDTALKASVPTPGDNLNKLYNLIVGGFKEVTVANIAARNAYNVTALPQNIFVTDDGDGNWALYKATTTGVGATFVKISDPDLLNAAMSASQIRTAYLSNVGTEEFTTSLLTKLNAITGTNTGNETQQSIGDLINGATAAAIANDDYVGFSKVSAGNILRKITWSTVVSTLKTYFDTIYATTTAFVKAVVADINTGTDDAKFLTALGLQGSKYMTRDLAKISGLTSGTNTAYTMTLTPTLSALVVGQPVIFQLNLVNAASATLNVDTTGAYPLQDMDGNAITTGVLNIASKYLAIYNGTAWQVLSAPGYKPLKINTQTASYTLTAADKGALIRMDVATANNLTVPPYSSVPAIVGTEHLITQVGAGATTVLAGSGVTILSKDSKVKLNGVQAKASLIKVADPNTWELAGDLTT